MRENGYIARGLFDISIDKDLEGMRKFNKVKLNSIFVESQLLHVFVTFGTKQFSVCDFFLCYSTSRVLWLTSVTIDGVRHKFTLHITLTFIVNVCGVL